jgi:hypothetical protein
MKERRSGARDETTKEMIPWCISTGLFHRFKIMIQTSYLL